MAKRGSKELWLAAARGDIERVERLLTEGLSDINAQVRGGLTPLISASTHGHLDAVKLLLEKGANINFHSKDGPTALHEACSNGHLEVVKLLLDSGANVSVKIRQTRTPLSSACLKGHTEVVKLLLSRGVDVEQVRLQMNSFLDAAAKQGNLEMTKLLVDIGADTESLSSALSSACSDDYFQVAKILLEKGADPSFPLIQAARLGNLDVMNFLLDNGASIECEPLIMSPLCAAATHGREEAVKLALDRGAKVNSGAGYVPLIAACEGGHLEVAKLLLANGANIEAEREGCTPLLVACENSHLEVIEFLLASGANIDAENEIGYTPLLTAAGHASWNIVKLLLQNNANVNMRSKEGSTPLGLVCGYQQLELAELLIQRGANVNVADSHNYSPLHGAARGGNLELVKLLVEHGANTSLASKSKRTPLMEAAVRCSSEKHAEVLKYLLPRSPRDVPAFSMAFSTSLKEGRLDICNFIIQAGVKVEIESVAVYRAIECKDPQSINVLQYMLENGCNLEYKHTTGGMEQTEQNALHLAVMTKQAEKVWLIMLHGADTTVPYIEWKERKTVWQLCAKGDTETYEALLHFWTPQTHKYHSPRARNAVISLLLLATKAGWPFDKPVLHKIISFFIYDYKAK